jgi:hypothetical protein
VCIEVIAKEALNKFQAKLLEKPEPPVRGIECFGLSGELSDCSTPCSEGEYLLKQFPIATTFRRVEALLSASGSGSGSWRKAFQSATANAILGLLLEGAMEDQGSLQ